MSKHHADRPTGPSGPYREPRRVAQSSEPRQVPRVKLILHGGVFTDMMFVVRTIMELTRFCLAEANHKTWEAHHSGRSQLLVTYKERAELYVEQFAARGLTVSIEPV